MAVRLLKSVEESDLIVSDGRCLLSKEWSLEALYVPRRKGEMVDVCEDLSNARRCSQQDARVMSCMPLLCQSGLQCKIRGFGSHVEENESRNSDGS